MDNKCIDFIGSLQERASRGQFEKRGVAPAFRPDRFVYDEDNDAHICPQGKAPAYAGHEENIGKTDFICNAKKKDCQSCRYRDKCCPGKAGRRFIARGVDHPAVAAFIQKMETEEARATCKKRGAIGEFPNARIKDKLGLRQFHLRGLLKAGMETLWACITYNVQQWIRLVWRPRLA
jgi:hypothetical protein